MDLQQTKDILERIIDTAVDSIVAPDMQGRVVRLNPGAERLFGYTAEEVIGRLSVIDLYPSGGARRVMQMLRSGQHGDKGRLKETRLDVVTKSGELVPVNMTASILYENGQEAATVGILSDLRERLAMEERLLVAQEQLEIQERQAMVAQLAGAAAHELNQPLTSIIGYGQLVERQSEPDAPHIRAVKIIVREASRMADIVRQIGRITRYETKEYVAGASIMDLERSAASSPDLRASSPDLRNLNDPSEQEAGEVTQVADAEPSRSLEDVVLADMADLGDMPDVVDMPEIDLASMRAGRGDEGPTGLDAIIEPAEEEITAQHHIVGRRSPTRPETSELRGRRASRRDDDRDNGDRGRERARTQGDLDDDDADDGDEDTRDGETGETPAGRIGATDSQARKSSDPPA